jgi:hypothetical protein
MPEPLLQWLPSQGKLAFHFANDPRGSQGVDVARGKLCQCTHSLLSLAAMGRIEGMGNISSSYSIRGREGAKKRPS